MAKKKYDGTHGKRGQKVGWHDYKYGNISERRLYDLRGKVIAKIPKKRKQ